MSSIVLNVDEMKSLSDRCDRVLVEPIRIAVEKYLKENEKTLTKLAYELGWINHRTKPSCGDLSRLRRTLGMRSVKRRDGTYGFQVRVNHKTALLLIKAIDRDPWEFGI